MTKLPRLYCDAPLGLKLEVPLTDKQTHYLTHVLRMSAGEEVLVFNGYEGEWRARLIEAKKKDVRLHCQSLERAQTTMAKLTYCFAPLKAARLDYMVQKAVEMGASCLQPVITDFTQNTRLNLERMRANVIEAAEQCGILSLATCANPIAFNIFLENWQQDHPLIFCDEAIANGEASGGAGSGNPLKQLQSLKNSPAHGVLIGPEGGFSAQERKTLQQKSFVHAISLGTRILRADTAAVAALALINATISSADDILP